MAESKGSSIRLVFWTAVIAFFGGAGLWSSNELLIKPMREKERKIEELEKRKEELTNFVKRLKHTERRAQIMVLYKNTDERGVTTNQIRFVELDSEGNPLNQGKEFTLIGEELYFDGLVITFEDNFIEEGDALKGKSLLLFRRVFSNKLEPQNGYPLDERGMEPDVYAASDGKLSNFERDLWGRFWSLANDKDASKALGVRAAHGKAVSIQPQVNKVYFLEMRATGDIILTPAAPLNATKEAPAEAKKN